MQWAVELVDDDEMESLEQVLQSIDAQVGIVGQVHATSQHAQTCLNCINLQHHGVHAVHALHAKCRKSSLRWWTAPTIAPAQVQEAMQLCPVPASAPLLAAQRQMGN